MKNDAVEQYLKQVRAAAEAAMYDTARDILIQTVQSAEFKIPAAKQDNQFSGALQKRFNRILYRIGRYVQATARNMIRWRSAGRGKKKRPGGIPSAPYSPPRIPLYRKNDSPLRSLMAFDFAGNELLIGPKVFRTSPNLRVKPRGGETIAAVLEHGGRQIMRTKLGTKTITYAPRPFMSIALVKAVNAGTFKSLMSQLDPL